MIGKILSNLTRKKKITEPISKIEIRKNETVFATRFSSINEDSLPLPTDNILVISLEQIGKKCCIGFIDPKNETSVNEGEKRIYSRDSGGGIQAEIYLKDSGLLEIQNQVQVLSALIEELFIELKTMTTTGGPTNQAIDATTQARLDLLLAKYQQLFG